jgi:hypothetical protein
MNNNIDKKEYLLRLLDYFYATIAALMIKSFYDNLSKLTHDDLNFINYIDIFKNNYSLELIASMIMLVGVFLFIIDDWVDSRYFNSVIGYDGPGGFARYLLDLLIAFLSYGAMYFALKRSIICLIFIAIIQFLVIFWLFLVRRACVNNNNFSFSEGIHKYLNLYIIANFFGIILCLSVIKTAIFFNLTMINIRFSLILLLIGYFQMVVCEKYEYKTLGYKKFWSLPTFISNLNIIRILVKIVGFLSDICVSIYIYFAKIINNFINNKGN